MKVFLHNSILQTGSSKFLLKILFQLRLQVKNSFGSTGSATLPVIISFSVALTVTRMDPKFFPRIRIKMSRFQLSTIPVRSVVELVQSLPAPVPATGSGSG